MDQHAVRTELLPHFATADPSFRVHEFTGTGAATEEFKPRVHETLTFYTFTFVHFYILIFLTKKTFFSFFTFFHFSILTCFTFFPHFVHFSCFTFFTSFTLFTFYIFIDRSMMLPNATCSTLTILVAFSRYSSTASCVVTVTGSDLTTFLRLVFADAAPGKKMQNKKGVLQLEMFASR